jgi:hypothetical protein
MAAGHVTSLRQLAGELTTGITMLTEVIAGLLAGYRGREPTPAVLPCDWAVIVIGLGVIPRSPDF